MKFLEKYSLFSGSLTLFVTAIIVLMVVRIVRNSYSGAKKRPPAPIMDHKENIEWK